MTTPTPLAPDIAVATFSFGARPVLPPRFPASRDLPPGALADAIAEVEEIWSRLRPIQDEGRHLFRQRQQVHHEDERQRMQAAAEGKRLPNAKLPDVDARLMELADEIRALRDAYQAVQRRVGTVAPEAWQAVADADAEQVKRDHQAVTSALANLRAAFDALRTSSQRRRWAASRGRHSGYAPEPMLDGRAFGRLLDALAQVPDRLAEPPAVQPDDRVLMLSHEPRREERSTA